MSKNRITFSDDVVLTSGNVGINIGQPGYKLEVNGTVYSTNDFRVTGDATLTGYDGFLKNQYTVDETITLSSTGQTNTLSQETIVPDDVTVTAPSGSTAGSTTLKTIKLKDEFTIPVGGTEDRPTTAKKGELRYNKDFASVEFWDGNTWRQVDNTTQRGRGIFGGGAPVTANMQYINIQSTGNSEDFGNLTAIRASSAGCSSSTRGLVGGSDYLGNYNTIDYITIASQGNGNDFGDLTYKRSDHSSCSSSTRGVWAGGYDPVAPAQSINVIDYVQISTLGDALDFGDLSDKVYSLSGCASPTRGIFAGGGIYGAPYSAVILTSAIRSITISSKGNSTKFGDLTSVRSAIASCSNAVRGLFAAGSSAPNINLNIISYVTISSYGNAIDFGNLAQGKSGNPSGVSNSTRGVFAGGVFLYPTRINTIEYISIDSGGNAIDFGDLANPRSYAASMSDSHGGLGGF